MNRAFLTTEGRPFQAVSLPSTKASFGGGDHNIVVDTSCRFQTHMGFGGAFTEAAYLATEALTEEGKREVIDAFFSKDGLCYNLARIPMHSTDFSERSRTYVEEGDDTLATFDISWDIPRLEFFKRCEERAGGLSTLLSTWSPPAYMKTNGILHHGGKLKEGYRRLWAEYFCKFIEEAGKLGVHFDMMSVQNEPEAVQTWESCIFTAEEEAYFIRDFLVPALRRHGIENMGIILWDHNRDGVVRRALNSLKIEGVRELVYGIGYHWYCCDRSENLSALHALYPDKHLFLTECCVELAHDSTTGKASYVGRWEHGERYGKNIINDLNNYSEGYIDWNLCLDERGGPNHVGNFCEAPVMIDRKSKKIMYMSSYYYIGHFSKFIRAGAVRAYSGTDVEKDLYTVAYVDPSGEKIIVIENTADKDLHATLTIDGKGMDIFIPAHSIQTVLVDE